MWHPVWYSPCFWTGGLTKTKEQYEQLTQRHLTQQELKPKDRSVGHVARIQVSMFCSKT
jgi:hypothetical protein